MMREVINRRILPEDVVLETGRKRKKWEVTARTVSAKTERPKRH